MHNLNLAFYMMIGWLQMHMAAVVVVLVLLVALYGVLLASGLIVGESLLAVIFAGVVAFSGKQNPIALVGDGFTTPAIWIGGVVFAVTVTVLYRWIIRMARSASAA